MSLPPGPRWPSPVQTAAWVARPLALFEHCARRYGDAFTLRLLGMREVVFLSSPSAIKEVFTGDPEALYAGEGNALFLRPVLGPSSVLVLDGTAHLRQRKLLLPPFHGERMQAYAEVMRAVTEANLARWPIGQPFALLPQMRAITLQIILRTVFGVDEAAGLGELSGLLAQMLDSMATPVTILPAVMGWDLLKLAPWLRPSRLKSRVDQALFREIARRRSAPRGADVLSMLLDARDEDGQPMSDPELRDELVTLLVAGHETTATGLAWTFERILLAPEVRARLASELAGAPQGGELLDAVIKEALRMRPIVPVVGRTLQRELTIAGHRLPAGTRVALCIYLTHRRPDLYPEPGTFRPERFLGRKPDPYGWLPFGGGIRRCLGMAFALFEMKVVLATVLRKAELVLANAMSARMVRRGITLAPRGGTRVVLRPRRADLPARPAAAAPPAA